MRTRLTAGTVAALACTAAIAAIAAIAGSGSAQAETGIEPAIINAEGRFFTQEQIQDKWAEVTTEFPDPLPDGISFPTETPAIFTPVDDSQTIYQDGLPSLIAARYWRCAWLDSELKAVASGDTRKSARAHSRIANYATLPFVSAKVDLAGYETWIAEASVAEGMTPAAFEYSIECALYADGAAA